MQFSSSAAAWASFAAYMLAVIGTAFVVRSGSIQQRLLWVSIFIAVAGGFAKVVVPSAAVAGYLLAALVALGAGVWALYDRRNESSRWLARASGAIVLHPPFRGRWRVAAGGPDPKHNHHQRVSDQYFAYDFVNLDGPSWEAPICAPCRGLVAHVEDRHDDAPPDARRRERKHPFGNYVSIETERGYVILAHLKRGSITVRAGDTVGPGVHIADCGNSGNTLGAHLHIHAQNQPTAAPNDAEAVPIAFLRENQPQLLEHTDTLTGP